MLITDNNLSVDSFTEKVIDLCITSFELLNKSKTTDRVKKSAEKSIHWAKKYLSSVFNLPLDNINVDLLKKYRDNPIYKKIGYSPFVASSLKKFWEEIFLTLNNLAKEKNTPVTLKDLPIEDYKKSLKILEEAIKKGELLPIEPMRRQYEFLPKFMSLFLSGKTLHITDFDPTHIVQVQALLQMEDFYKSQIRETYDHFELKQFKLIFNELLMKGHIKSNTINEDFLTELGRNIRRALRSQFWPSLFTIYTPPAIKHLQRIFIHEGLLKKCQENNGNFSFQPADTTNFIAHLVEGRALFDVSDKGEMLIDSHKESQKEKPSFTSTKSALIDQEGHQISLVEKDGIYYAQKTAKELDNADAIVLAVYKSSRDDVIILGPDNRYKLINNASATPAVLTLNDNQLIASVEEEAPSKYELNELTIKNGLNISYVADNAKREFVNRYQLAGNTIKLLKSGNFFYATPSQIEKIDENNRIIAGKYKDELTLSFDKKIQKYTVTKGSLSKEPNELTLNDNGILIVSYLDNRDVPLNLFVTRGGKFIIRENPARTFHSSPVSGACVKAPLQIQIQQGMPVELDNHSGHYRPKYLVIYDLINIFEKYKLNLSRLIIPVRSRKKILALFKKFEKEFEKELEEGTRTTPVKIEDVERKHLATDGYQLTVAQFNTLMKSIINDSVKDISLIKNFVSNLTKEQINILDGLLKLISEFVNIDCNLLQPLDPEQKKTSTESIRKKINDIIKEINKDDTNKFFNNTIQFFDLFNSEPSGLEDYYDLIEILVEAAANQSNPLLFCYYKFLDIYNEAKKLFPLKSELPFIFTVDLEHYQNIINELKEKIVALNSDESATKRSAENILKEMQIYYLANPFFFEKRDTKLVVSLHWACLDYLIENDVFFDKAPEKFENVSNLLIFLQQKPLSTATIISQLEEFCLARSLLPRLKFNSEKINNAEKNRTMKPTPLTTFVNQSLIKTFQLEINEQDPLKCFNLIQQQLKLSFQAKHIPSNEDDVDVELEDRSSKFNRASL